MRRISALFVVAIVSLVVHAGCFSYSTLHTATPVEEGETEMTLTAGFYGAGIAGDSGDIPNSEFMVRHGITDASDLGFKVYPVGFAFDYNHALAMESGYALSVNPYLSVTRFSADDGSFTYGAALLNILADVIAGEAATLTFGLKPGFLYAMGSFDDELETANTGVIGITGGIRVNLGDSFTVMPTFDVLTPFDEFADLWLYTFGVAMIF